MARIRRPQDPLSAAEAVFKPAVPKPVSDAPKPKAIPGAKQSVTLRIDEDVLESFQAEGPGWQDRINAALRGVAGL